MPSVSDHLLIRADLELSKPYRFTPGSGYLEALVAPNAQVVTQPIERITEKGIRTVDGVEYGVDVLICATGFDTSFRPRFPIIGVGGQDLAEWWRDEPVHYLSVATPGFPNYFSRSLLTSRRCLQC